jgi:hypothetical protein
MILRKVEDTKGAIMNIKTNMLLKILFENNIYELYDNCLENNISSTKILKIPKRYSKAINRRRTDNAMAKRKKDKRI